jgi:hypothetical protein
LDKECVGIITQNESGIAQWTIRDKFNVKLKQAI